MMVWGTIYDNCWVSKTFVAHSSTFRNTIFIFGSTAPPQSVTGSPSKASALDFMILKFEARMDGSAGGRADGRTGGRTDGRTVGRTEPLVSLKEPLVSLGRDAFCQILNILEIF